MKIGAAFAFLMAMQPVAAFMGPAAQTTSQTALSALPPKDTDNKGLDGLFSANKEWIKQKKSEDPEFFNKLGTTHAPDFMWIGRLI